MLDLTAVLDRGNGVVSASNAIMVGEAPARFWSVGALIDCSHNDDGSEHPLPTCQTGACSSSRTQATVRTVGEAVERLALHPRSSLNGDALCSGAGAGIPPMRARFDDVRDRSLHYFQDSLSLGADPQDRELHWHTGRRLGTGEEILIPVGLIDYPLSPAESRGFDPGPSGAAAGTSFTSALKSALLEVIERDSIIVAWAKQLRLGAIDPVQLIEYAPREQHWSMLRTTLKKAAAGGLEPIAAEVPTSVQGVVCVVGGFRTELDGAPFICLGAKASDHLGKALLGACEESLQLWFGLASGRLTSGASAPPPVVTTDLERVGFLASCEGRAAVADWLSDPLPHTREPSTGDLDVRDLLDQLRDDGLDPIAVDLSDRLPPMLEQHGWHVVKVIPAGYQPLRIDESTHFGWNVDRLESAARRTGSPSRLAASDLSPYPHPLP